MNIASKIHHRINTLTDLKLTNKLYGVEVDVRYHNDELILHHDAFGHHKKDLTSLKDLAENFKDHEGHLILNLKTEGIEQKCIDIMNEFQIENWFFLDMSPPYFVKYAQFAADGSIKGFSPENLAVRFSEKESIEYALAFKGQARWIWIDCFTHLPLNNSNFDLITKSFKICLVSPELQGHSIDKIQEFKNQLKDRDIDAVCSKRLDLW